MARNIMIRLIYFGIFLTIMLLVGAILIAAAWCVWIVFITWMFNHPWDRQIVIATSGFWIITGAIVWAILRR